MRTVQFLGILLVVLGLGGWYTNNSLPDHESLAQTTGIVTNITDSYGKYGKLDGIKFGLENVATQFYYASFYPNFARAENLLKRGATAQVLHDRKANEIWSLTVSNEVVADREGIKKGRHSNGNWALVYAIGFAAVTIGIELCIRRTALRGLKGGDDEPRTYDSLQ